MPNAVIVIDMLRGFLEKGYPLYCGQNSRSMIPNVQQLLEQELARGSKVFFFCDRHRKDDPEFRMFPPHSIEGTVEAEIIPELSGYPGEIVSKSRYSGFYGTPMESKLKALNPEKVIVCGVCTNICVLHTVANARERDYEVEVPVDCVASFDQRAHAFGLEHIEKVLGATLTRVSKPGIAVPKFDVSTEVLAGDTADIYFVRTVEILKREDINPVATMEVFSSRPGILCGMHEVHALLDRVLPANQREVWSLSEGDTFERKEVVLRITAPYQSYGMYETAYLGMLAQPCGWATAARECVEAAGGIPVISFGARHVHPSVVGLMDYAAIVGGCTGCSSVSGAKLAGIDATGTIPHALILVMGDTVSATLAFDRHMPADTARVALVDTFKDEPEESIDVARTMQGRLQGVRLDTPPERGRVSPDLVKETRARLDLAGFKEVKIFVSGGVDPERIRDFVATGAPVDAFGVGSHITKARPVDFTADLHEVAGKPVAKRGRIPGITPSPRLKQVM